MKQQKHPMDLRENKRLEKYLTEEIKDMEQEEIKRQVQETKDRRVSLNRARKHRPLNQEEGEFMSRRELTVQSINNLLRDRLIANQEEERLAAVQAKSIEDNLQTAPPVIEPPDAPLAPVPMAQVPTAIESLTTPQEREASNIDAVEELAEELKRTLMKFLIKG